MNDDDKVIDALWYIGPVAMTGREAACILSIKAAIRRIERGDPQSALAPLRDAAALFDAPGKQQ